MRVRGRCGPAAQLVVPPLPVPVDGQLGGGPHLPCTPGYGQAGGNGNFLQLLLLLYYLKKVRNK